MFLNVLVSVLYNSGKGEGGGTFTSSKHFKMFISFQIDSKQHYKIIRFICNMNLSALCNFSFFKNIILDYVVTVSGKSHFTCDVCDKCIPC